MINGEKRKNFQTASYINLTVHRMLCYQDIFTSMAWTVFSPLLISIVMFSSSLAGFLLSYP